MSAHENEAVRLLDDLQVEISTGIAGPFLGKLFADAGADVVKVEPAGGDLLRSLCPSVAVPPGEDGALFGHLNVGKRSIVSSPGDDARLAACCSPGPTC